MKDDIINLKINIDSKEVEKSLQKIIDKLSGISTNLEKVSKDLNKVSAKDLFDEMKLGIELTDLLSNKLKITGESTKKYSGQMKDAKSFTDTWNKALGVTNTTISGLVTGTKGLSIVTNSMKDMQKEGANLSNVLEGLGGLASTAAAGAQIGSIFGPMGTAIGGIAGAATGAVSGLISFISSAKEAKKAARELVAKEDLFGDLNISLEEWGNILENSGPKITDYKEKLDSLNATLASYNSAFQESSEALDLYGYKFGIIGQKISEEDSVKIKDAIKDMGENSSKIIEESTNFSLSLWGDTFSEISCLTEEEQKNILSSIYNYGESQKLELKTAQDNITTTYDEAIKTRGYLTDEEYIYIQEQLQKIKDLTNNEMSTHKANIEYYKKQFADESLALDEESYASFEEALAKHQKTEQDKIEEGYRIRMNDAEKYRSDDETQNQVYLKKIATANEWRRGKEKELNDFLKDTSEEVYESIANKYVDLKNDNNENAKEQKEIIEGIFKNIDVDSSEIESKFSMAGKRAKAELVNSVSGNVMIGTTMQYFAKNLPQKTELVFNGGIYANGSWQNIPQYANGGLPSHGSMFIAGERGAEIVGHINGRTEVLNRSQIASAIYSAVATAMSNYGSNSQDIRVYAEEGLIVEKVSNGINKHVKQTGRLPFMIPL